MSTICSPSFPPYVPCPDLSSILLCNARAILLCDDRHIQHIREDGEGLAVGHSSCGAWCTSCGSVVLPCLSHPGTMDQKTLRTFSSVWHRRALGKEIARVLCPTHKVWGTWPAARKSEAIWVSHFNHQPLLSCLPLPLLAKVQICQYSLDIFCILEEYLKYVGFL